MIFLLFALFSEQVIAQTEPSAPPAATAAPAAAVPSAPPPVAAETVPAPAAPSAEEPAAKESTDYEVDYEEEPGADDAEEPVEVKPVKKGKKSISQKNSKESVSQGSIASKKFAPILKSDTKSIYKKNGKQLDVDSD